MIKNYTMETDNIINLYTKSNKNTKEIADIYGTYNTTIRRILIRNNIKLRTSSEVNRKVTLDTIKNQEGSPNFDYFLGLLITDGCITSKNRVVLDFSEKK